MTCIGQTGPIYCLEPYTKRVRPRQYTEPVCPLQVIQRSLLLASRTVVDCDYSIAGAVAGFESFSAAFVGGCGA